MEREKSFHTTAIGFNQDIIHICISPKKEAEKEIKKQLHNKNNENENIFIIRNKKEIIKEKNTSKMIINKYNDEEDDLSQCSSSMISSSPSCFSWADSMDLEGDIQFFIEKLQQLDRTERKQILQRISYELATI